jgi:ubiquinone/menaquinone biosynthesis C-methylase UbiE
MRTHRQSLQEQFDPQAQAYLLSAVHARGPDLEHAVALARQALPATSLALDVGCGAGHLSFALAPSLAHMVALDRSAGMLATVAETAAARGLPQIETCQASAESLPFVAGSFDLVCTRYSAHHWTQLPVALEQMRRVVRAAGRLLLIDTLGHADPLVDTHLQAIELLRDPSHVRNRTLREWYALLEAAGFGDIQHFEWPTRLAFSPWVERMRTPAERVTAIRSLQDQAPSEVHSGLALEADGSFTIRTALFWAQPAR